MQKKPSKKKRTQSSKSKQKVKKMRAYNESNCSLLQDVGSISDLFKNQALKKKGASMQNTSQINFNSTINNYTSVYTVISSSLKPQKTKSTKNIIQGKVVASSMGQKKKAPMKQKSKGKLVTQSKQQTKKKKQPIKQQRMHHKNHNQSLQQYQLIPQSKNSLNSEIVFSTQQTKRQSQQSIKRRQQSSRIYDSLTRISQENLLINNNKMLRSTIRQEFKRKNSAATKIQKVFRGYLTRKILQKYIKKQQEKLMYLLNQYQLTSQRAGSLQQEQQHLNQRSRQRNISSSNNNKHTNNSNQCDFFSNKVQQSSRNYSPKTFLDEQSINLSKINHSQYKFNQEQEKQSSSRVHSNRFFNSNKENQIVNCSSREVRSSCEEEEQGDEIGVLSEEEDQQKQGELSNNNHKNQLQEQQQHNDRQSLQSQSSQQQGVVAYRHHEVIYNGSQIQQYLQSSQQQIDDNNQDEQEAIKGKKEKIDQMMINKDQIIFQTSEQHMQSRKNSLLNRNTQQQQQNKKHSQNYTKNAALTQQAPMIFMQQHSEQQSLAQYIASIDPDLIKTSKVNSIHNHSKSHRTSFREEPDDQLSPRRKKEDKEDHSQKTSKKQCKKVAYPKHMDINISSNDDSQLQVKKSSKMVESNENLQTIKALNTNQKLQPNIPESKKAFMSTISYNSQFKNKHHIDNLSLEKVNEKKQSLKKKIYYFSDSSDHQEENQKEVSVKGSSTPSRKSRKYSPRMGSPNELQRLKNSQMQRWDEVIRLINCQLGDSRQQIGKSKQFQGFIKQVMELSLKNKEMLQQMLSQQNSYSKNDITFKNSRIDEILDQKDNEQEEEKEKKWKQFKDTLSSGRRKSITEQDIAVFKPHSRIVLSSKGNNFGNEQKPQPLSPRSKPSFFKESKDELKEKINKIELENMKHIEDSRVKQFSLLNNIQNDQIQQMLKVREEMLQKRECDELSKLNEKLIRKQITQKEFLASLSKLTQNFQSQKHSIDKAREDITRGYNAAVKLIKQAFYDAKKVGYKMPLSKSSDSYKLNKHLGFNVLSGLNNVIIDELNSKQHLFAMKHAKPLEITQKVEAKSARQSRQSEPEIEKHHISIHFTQSKYAQVKQSEAQIQQRSPAPNCNLQTDVIPNTSKTFSQSSQSIINNLSSSPGSFVKHFYQTQPQPKPIQQPAVSDLKKNIFYPAMNSENNFDDFGSEESEEVEFSEEELRRFRKAQPYDPSIADLNKNLMIGKDFFEMQKTSFQQNDSNQNTDRYDQDDKNSNSSDTQLLRMKLYRQVYEIQENDHMDVSSYKQNNKIDPKIEFIVEKELQFLLFEFSVELLMKPLFSEKFLFQKRQQMFGIKKVSDNCRKKFIDIIQQILPKSQQLFNRVNQNISPLPKQLLKCMRIDFSEQDEQDGNQEEYEQIGKYEMILDQQLCSTAIERYRQQLNQQKENKFELQLLTGDNTDTLKQQLKGLAHQQWQQKAFSYIDQRQKFVLNRKQHCQSIRWQFINMQLHCLFDAWNEQIIQLKNNRNGFSGIGLNELTLSMIDRNKKIKAEEIEQMMTESKYKLMKILNFEEQIIEQINKQICSQNMHLTQQQSISCDTSSRISSKSSKSLTIKLKQTQQKYAWVYQPNKQADDDIDTEEQSKWIYYSDEALSYGLELVYLVEEDLFGEMAKELRKMLFKGQMV